MSIQVALYHHTSYTYDKEITIHPHVVRLRPAPHCRTPILSYSLTIHPENHFINWQQDPFGNYLARIVFPEKSDKLQITVDLIADLTAINPFDFFLEESAEKYPFTYDEELANELSPYLGRSDHSEKVDELAAEFKELVGTNTNDFLVAVNGKLEKLIDYKLRMEPGVQTCEETLTLKSGSCRDSAFLLCQVFRELGIASRFVSGYLVQLSSDEECLDGPSGPATDFTDLHAWTEVFLPGAGWVGLDPTSGLMASEGHIPLACTPEPSSAAPVEGGIEPAEAEFDFANVVTRIHEDPRVTLPYTENEWASIDALGDQVDEMLNQGDVRLTMGGEPTFVSIDDMEGDEWNTTADSPAKRERAMDLTKRLRERFAPGGLLWIGEGKWYPGEPVPRWAYGIFWRKDGYPMWRSAATMADPLKPGSHTLADPEKLLREIAFILQISEDCVTPAYEDFDYYRWKASSLPVGQDPSQALEGEASLEVKTLARLEARGLTVPSGAILPMYVQPDSKRWVGAKWEFKRGKLFLIPGASAMGFRIPLDSIRAATKEDVIEPRSPMEAEWPELAPNPLDPYLNGGPTFNEDEWIPRTALTVECREGRIHIFFPPVPFLENYLELLAAIELAAERTSMEVIIEGYEPPVDPRIESLKVTPDPGVIEVNVHPTKSWREMVENTNALYEEARLSRLCAEKFMIDGRHTGTGGGNHIVMGASTPADSPFLRRPSLLASLIGYWQHHPGLSYLFSGLFIGPTSQAPRVDEGRDDRLFELDIALETLHKGVDNPGLVDRTLRNLLTDLTGNTHRAEICIDKLCSPDSNTGKLGLLELRGFEMPPHREMSLVQNLLVRSLIARFWNEPFTSKSIRWGTTLHDRYLLPHYVKEDLLEVCEELNDAGIPFQSSWLDPFFEFRFPRFGFVTKGGMELEVRSALEPWNVLGEESTSAGTSRFVDSSVERLQVKVNGMIEGRHMVTCNGREIPMSPGSTREEWVGGVRFKAWDPPSALHPSIPAQTQLVIDIVDTRNRKSLGGCVYYVSHPGGRSHETFPVNAREAESRRRARFWEQGYTPGLIETDPVIQPLIQTRFEEHEGGAPVTIVVVERRSAEFSHTLDLRKP